MELQVLCLVSLILIFSLDCVSAETDALIDSESNSESTVARNLLNEYIDLLVGDTLLERSVSRFTYLHIFTSPESSP